ncbi:hypothetical protein J8J42_11760 [Chryseobacterium sp. cx-311]|uniref:hypothetical protein n=1 Tax=Marnyiella aurantia TaxID=2758037 RepID=UPI001AEA6827|nr:hypothetical protein [Marnyiella aurantia]MBP0613713.1 hypothetical protein [Marnyiella aurantia]
MTDIKHAHTFHIPVMGLAFTIDSPLRVAQYGIDSVISIMDDDLIEKMNAFYSDKFKRPYQEVTQKMEDFRAKRITNYLNMMDSVITEKFESYKQELTEKQSKLEEFMSILPSTSGLKQKLQQALTAGKQNLSEIRSVLDEYFSPGSIDVNIMTKVDKDNFSGKEQLPVIYNDAHAALRGFAASTTKSSVVFSAGMNPRLYSYIEAFDDFYPDENGAFNKKIILKVSDFRSATVQANLLAKKGIWISEFRIESGLNCGGHAFATEGHLMGPILAEFRSRRTELEHTAYDLLVKALEAKGKVIPSEIPKVKYTVQGGVGTAEEHQFLLEHYQMDSVGWGSPFLLVPEATSVDPETRELLAKAKEEDLYLSNISPLGVPFNTLRGTSNEILKSKRADSGKAGSSCPKKYLALSKEYEAEGICTASRKYQDRKIEELNERKTELSPENYNNAFGTITEKSCLCVGLANSSYIELGLPVKGQAQGVVVCPGPNIAYFSKTYSLKEMIQHIYGEKSAENHSERPNVMLKELNLYIENLSAQLQTGGEMTAQQIKKWEAFKSNLLLGISYYKDLFAESKFFSKDRPLIQAQLSSCESVLLKMQAS